MANTIGKLVGIISHTFGVSRFKGDPDKQTITVKYDFTLASDADIKSWLTSDRTIAHQKPLRGLTHPEITDHSGNTVLAQNAGLKIKSRSEQIAVYTNMGLPNNLAEMAVDDPAKFKSIMDEVDDNE